MRVQRPGGTSIAIGAFWLLITVVCVLGFVNSVYKARVAARPALHIEQAEEIAADGSRRAVTLPQVGHDESGTVVSHVYEIDFSLDAAPDAPLLLHVPYYEQRLDVAIGGETIFTSDSARPWGGMFTHSTALITLPADRLVAGRNRLTLTISSGPNPPFALSTVLVGTATELRGLYLIRAFLKETMRPILFGLQAFLAFSALVSFALRPSNAMFGWLGLMMSLSTFVGMGVLSRIFPGVQDLTQLVMLMSPIATLSLLGFTLALSDGRRHAGLLGLIVGVFAVLVLLRYGLSFSARQVGFGLAIPIAFMAILASMAVLLRLVWRRPRLETILLTASLGLLAAGVAHDYLLRAGIIHGGFFLAQFTRVVSLVAIALILVRHQTEIADELDRSADVLRRRLSEKEAELAHVYARQKAQDEARLLDEERARITANLHDGVAGHLTTIVALADQPDNLSGHIKQSARNALADLRLVIDALGVEDGDLLFYLGQFRARCVEPLERLGVAVEWSMTGLPETGPITRERALNVLRILQEAVNNALRHGTPERLEIRGGPAGPGRVQIMVSNSCASSQEAEESGGLGLASMRQRAESLGGSFTFIRSDDSADLVIDFPA